MNIEMIVDEQTEEELEEWFKAFEHPQVLISHDLAIQVIKRIFDIPDKCKTCIVRACCSDICDEVYEEFNTKLNTYYWVLRTGLKEFDYIN